MVVPLTVPVMDCCARDLFPLSRRGESLEIQKGPVMQGRVGNANDSPKVEESLLIDLVLAEQVGVVTKISEKPVELPQRPFCAIQPAGEGASCERLRFQDNKSNHPEWFLRMPAIGSPLDTDEEWALKPLLAVVCPQVQAGNMALHDFASTGWA